MQKLPPPIIDMLRVEIDPAFAKRANFIFKIMQRVNPQRVLDAGCGRGFYVRGATFFPQIKQIIGIDLRKEYLVRAAWAKAEKRVQLQVADIYSLPFKNNYFDLVISSEVMEHLPDDVSALKELYRVTKPGGTLVISVPPRNFPFLWDPLNWCLMKFFHTHVPKDIWWLAGIWADHQRLYTLSEISSAARQAGWKVNTQLAVVHYCWPFSHFLLYGIGKNLVERWGAKSFDRFTIGNHRIARVLAAIFAWPSSFDPADLTSNTAVDLILKLKKSS